MADPNSRGIGSRLLGMRRVDAATGGPISVRQEIVRLAVAELSSGVSAALLYPAQKRDRERTRALRSAVEEIKQRHPDDQDTVRRKTAELHAQHGVNSFRGCLRPFAVSLALELPVFFSAQRQNLPDRVAGIIVVRD